MTTFRTASRFPLWPLQSLGLSPSHSGHGARADQSRDQDHAGRAALEYWADRGRQLIKALVDGPGLRGRSGGSPGDQSGVNALPDGKPSGVSVAHPYKIIWIEPADIIFRSCCDDELPSNDIKSGDWDLNRAPLDETPKSRSIRKRYLEGASWEETDLFKNYAQRLGSGETVRGADSLLRLQRQYEAKVDALFRDLGARGFLIERDKAGRPTNLPYVHIGRNGELLYGKKGNHRLTMAKLLSLRWLPCQVRTRHSEWQKIRDMIATPEGAESFLRLHRDLRRHPDLIDLMYPNQ
jgi:hypothetical protein